MPPSPRGPAPRTPRPRPRRRRPGQRYWSPWTVFGVLFLWMYGVFFLIMALGAAAADGPWMSLATGSFALILFAVPVCGYLLRHRHREIKGPRQVTLAGRPALHMPGERTGMPISAVLYWLLGTSLIAFGMDGWGEGEGWPGGVLVSALPGAFFLSYSLFAITGRFVEEGLYLDEWGVTVRARGLRARIPWSSISDAAVVRRIPGTFPRVAIRLVPGGPREVHVTTPWWIGSPRPRRDTVYLTEVQLPGVRRYFSVYSLAGWITEYARNPPTSVDLTGGPEG